MRNSDKCAFSNCGKRATCKIIVSEYPPRFQELPLCSYHQRLLASPLATTKYRITPDISENLRSTAIAILKKEGKIQVIKHIHEHGFDLMEAKAIWKNLL